MAVSCGLLYSACGAGTGCKFVDGADTKCVFYNYFELGSHECSDSLCLSTQHKRQQAVL